MDSKFRMDSSYYHRFLLIPDVHGRRFWKKYAYDFPGEIIFLGDYLDPYPIDLVSQWEAIDNFSEILSFAMRNPYRVTLLLGNHDLHYLSEEFRLYSQCSRYDWKHADIIGKVFRDNVHLFKLARLLITQERRLLITHAGLHSGWLLQHKDLIPSVTEDNLNALLKTSQGIQALAECGYQRGGDSPVGSIVWADRSEMEYSQPIALGDVSQMETSGCYDAMAQIFGHTRVEKPTWSESSVCIDTGHTYKLDYDLKELD